jgi:hypothetical protein
MPQSLGSARSVIQILTKEFFPVFMLAVAMKAAFFPWNAETAWITVSANLAEEKKKVKKATYHRGTGFVGTLQ